MHALRIIWKRTRSRGDAGCSGSAATRGDTADVGNDDDDDDTVAGGSGTLPLQLLCSASSFCKLFISVVQAVPWSPTSAGFCCGTAKRCDASSLCETDPQPSPATAAAAAALGEFAALQRKCLASWARTAA